MDIARKKSTYALLIIIWQTLRSHIQLGETRGQAVVRGNSSKLQLLQAAEWYENSMNYWPFEELSNRNVKDYIGSNDGRIGGAFRTVSGIVGSALALSGNGSWVDFSFLQSTCLNSPSTCPTGFTIAFWLKIPDFQGNRVVLQLGQHRYSRGFTVWTRASGERNLAFSVNTRRRKYSWIQDWTRDDWNHIALKWDNTRRSLIIYFNCTVVKVVDSSEDAEYGENEKASRLILGASHAIKKNMKLAVDEFAIWNRIIGDDTLCKVFNTRSVHGDYSNWSRFSHCSLSCGNGTKQRTRNCSNPAPTNRGRNCSSLGPSEEHMACFLRKCPIDGNYSHWTEFSPCSQTCGNGTSQRTRKCSNPEPQYGGRNCSHLGLEIETRECNTLPCPINGGFTPWSEFSKCEKSCGNGTRHRTRSCTNPSPKYGGLNCSHLGAEIEKEQCNTQVCPIHGGYGHWTAFSQCTKSCGNGTKQRTRTCSNPEPDHGGMNCSSLGPPIELEKCNTHYCPVNGGYTLWTKFSSCSKSCGNAVQQRTRNCSSPTPLYGGKNCSRLGIAVEKRRCFLRMCPINGGFTQWSPFGACSASCNFGIRNRTRECANPRPKHGGQECVGKAIEIEVCNMFFCPSHGGYTTWSRFSLCSKSCGNGTMERTRRCSNPSPKHGGNDCSLLGPAKETRDCSVFPCPIHGNYSSWSEFSRCSKTCGNGTTVRERNCSNPAARHGGKNCSHLGPAEETKSCNVFPCPIHGNYSSWSEFSRCSKTCDNGTTVRERNCSNPGARHGGKNCSHLGPAEETKSCNVFPCPIHGNYSSWSEFSRCSKTCGNGTTVRERNCSNPAAKHGGKNCSHLGPAEETKSCNVFPCPIHGNYSSWSVFSSCSETCGNGTKIRTRNCSNPAPKHGGRNCSSLGFANEVGNCNVFPCPIHGNYSSWSNFSQCSRSCGGGNKTRTRQCTVPIPQHGGQDCSRLGLDAEVQPCNTFPCPVDGGYGEWTDFKPCTKTCEGGKRRRTRHCTNPPPLHGGRNCSHLGPSVQSNDCNTQNCPDITFRVTVNLTSRDDQSKLATKIHEGVTQILGREAVSVVKVFNFRKGSVNFSISLFHRYYQGITRLQDAIYMNGKLAEGLPVTAVRLSSTDVPSMAPRNISVASSSSSSVRLEWSPIPTDFTNGGILGYRLTYYPNATRDEEARNMSKNHNILDGAQLSADVDGLEKFTAYCFRIAGMNHRGVGLDSLPVCARTDEDKPSLAPSDVHGDNISSTSLLVRWRSIRAQFVHGVLLGYHVNFSSADRKGHGDVGAGFKTTGAANTSAVIGNLLKYTKYKIQVSGYTAKGNGPLSDAILVSTDEDVPSKPPANVTANNLTSTSIKVRWKALSPRDANGILYGYKISYIEADPRNGSKWNETVISWNTTSVIITDLRKFTKYRVCVEGFTVKGSGNASKSVAVTTAEDRPDTYPLNLTGFDLSSTKLFVEWQPIPKQHINGNLMGYRVLYAPSKSYQPFSETVVNSPMPSTTLINLKKFTNYTIKVAGFTSKGPGPYSPAIKRRTSEDVPSKAAMSVRAWNTSHTSIHVAWGNIPTGFVHGVLLGYRVLFWRANESEEIYETKVVDRERRSVELDNLWIFTNYSIQVLGFTSVGDGAVSRTLIVSTGEFIPSLPPVYVRAANKTSPTKILVEWNPIPDPFYVHGILRGYRVFYTVIAVANDSIEDAMETNLVTVGPKLLSVELLNLAAFTRYEIQVLAFTVKGDGVKSKPIRAETCNCHSTLYTNWWISPPYVDSADSNKSGIITPILKRVIRTCCENCTAHGYSRVDFDHTASGGPAKKSGLVQFKRSFEENTELHYPVYGFMDQTRYSNNYGFVPFVQSPGLALIIIGDEEGTAAKLLLSTLALCWPILFLSIVMLWVSSTALWFVETAYNERHFPHNVLQGSWEAIWWAFASMTTLGYGDRIPRTPFGRLLCLSWILLGLVMLTCFNSTMTTLLTARILNKDVSLYGTKIAAIQNSSEYRLAIRKNARVNPNGKKYTNLEEVYDALTNRDVKGILIDAFTVGSKKNLFNRRDLRISKLLDYSSAYGVVLGGEGKKLQKCFQKYVGEQRSEISKIVEDNVEMIEVTSKSMTVQRSKGLFDPQFPTYIRAMIACGVLLSVIWLVGAKFELAQKMGWIKLKRKATEDGVTLPRSIELMRNKEELKGEMSRIVFMFKMNCEYRKRALQEKHRKELSLLAKLKKQTDSKLVKNPSFVNSILTFTLGGRTFTTVSKSYRNTRNGHIRWNSSLKKKNEIETLV